MESVFILKEDNHHNKHAFRREKLKGRFTSTDHPVASQKRCGGKGLTVVLF